LDEAIIALQRDSRTIAADGSAGQNAAQQAEKASPLNI
jgi:hypothetical protein